MACFFERWAGWWVESRELELGFNTNGMPVWTQLRNVQRNCIYYKGYGNLYVVLRKLTDVKCGDGVLRWYRGSTGIKWGYYDHVPDGQLQGCVLRSSRQELLFIWPGGSIGESLGLTTAMIQGQFRWLCGEQRIRRS